MADKKVFIAYDFQGNKIKGLGAPSANDDAATKASAQAQADAAKAAAEATAATLATTAKTEAIAAAAADAATKANNAVTTANSYTDTAVAGAGTTNLQAAKDYTDGKISGLVNGAGAALDTLSELATALGNDANFATTVATNIATVQTNLNTEITNRTTADTALQTQITGIDTRLTAAEGTITTLSNGAMSKFKGTITGSPTATSEGYEYTLIHNIGKADIFVQVYNGNDVVDAFIRKVNNNSLKVITGAALGTTVLDVVVIG